MLHSCVCIPSIPSGTLERWLSDIVQEVVNEGATEAVRETMLEMVDSHLERAAVYDLAVDVMNETIEHEAPELVSCVCVWLYM